MSRKKPHNEENLLTENEGLALITGLDKTVVVPTKGQKAHLLQLMGVSSRFIRTFDAIRLKGVKSFQDIRNATHFELIEVKVTQKDLKDFPRKFFFGMTENEQMLLMVLEPNYKLCLVSLAKDGAFEYLDYSRLKSLVKNKRITYQINL